MNSTTQPNPAELAALESQRRVNECIDERRHFLVEAGAGAGKTYSLVDALKHVVRTEGEKLLRRNQRVACITYTNVATEEIRNRTDRHSLVHSETIHAFCWSLIRSFQPTLRSEVAKIERIQEELASVGGVGQRAIEYSLGYFKIADDHIALHHNDVLLLTIALLQNAKFRQVVAAQYPVLFIDEYQDTDKAVAASLLGSFLDEDCGLRIGFFGDHWQKIYGNGCGKLGHSKLEVIGKESNFRSVSAVVDVLNRMRPELPQKVADREAAGSAEVFHTNNWPGTRLTANHWQGDLPTDEGRRYLDTLKQKLHANGWDFETPGASKVLMLTHRGLATEQGYERLLSVFPNNDALIKKEDPYIAFFVDVLEPACSAYERKKYGEMVAAVGGHLPRVHSQAEKERLAREMDELVRLRATGSVGDVLDCIERSRIRLPNAIERTERGLNVTGDETNALVERARTMRSVSYREVLALERFINGQTPFATKHGVKGAEFENVLVVVGRGWNQYDFGQMLELYGSEIPSKKQESFERNRNLFYVACSRAKRRLALLFTQKLSTGAIATLEGWFGGTAINAM